MAKHAKSTLDLLQTIDRWRDHATEGYWSIVDLHHDPKQWATDQFYMDTTILVNHIHKLTRLDGSSIQRAYRIISGADPSKPVVGLMDDVAAVLNGVIDSIARPRTRPTKDSVEENMARLFLKMSPVEKFTIDVREMSERLGVSVGMIGKIPAWKDLQKEKRAHAKHVRHQEMTDDILASRGADGKFYGTRGGKAGTSEKIRITRLDDGKNND